MTTEMREVTNLLMQVVEKQESVSVISSQSTFVSTKITSQGRQTLIDDHLATTVSAVSTTSAVAKVYSPLKFQNLQSLFYSWYKDSLSCYTPKDRFEKSVLKKLSKVIIYMKRFIPATCTILSSKPDPSSNMDGHRDLMRELILLIKQVEQSTMHFVGEQIKLMDTSKALKPNTIAKAVVWSTKKLLDSIAVSKFPPSCLVSDSITVSSENIFLVVI